MDSYRTIEQKLIEYKPFKGQSMTGIWHGTTYLVYSYDTLIAVANPEGMNLDAHKYSRTTTRHQDLIRRAWNFKETN
jgi:hypothetical protein